MQRVLKDTAPTLYRTFEVDGVATDPAPNTATITITRDNGTVLVAAAAATDATGVGRFSYTLTTTHTSLLDTLTVAWTSGLGTITDTAEVAGGFLFTIAEARAVPPLESTTKYTTEEIVAARTLAEQALEDACDVAFVPRYGTETLDGSGGVSLFLSRPRVTSIRSATVDGTAYTAGQLANFVPRPSGVLVDTGGSWTAGYGNVVLTYEHGWPAPPERVKRAALRLAKRWLVEGPVDDRATSLSSEDGTFALMTPGVGGALFDIPEVEAVVQQYGLRVSIA